MKFTIEVIQSSWNTIFLIPRGTVLPRGKKGLSREVILSANRVRDRFGCYTWATNGKIRYCGSFLDYAKYESNFEGRIYQYFSNHKRRPDGSPSNTNARVFDLLNEALETTAVALQVFRFESLKRSDESIAFASYTTDSYLVKAVERLLIWTYKNAGQCRWNDPQADGKAS